MAARRRTPAAPPAKRTAPAKSTSAAKAEQDAAQTQNNDIGVESKDDAGAPDQGDGAIEVKSADAGTVVDVNDPAYKVTNTPEDSFGIASTPSNPSVADQGGTTEAQAAANTAHLAAEAAAAGAGTNAGGDGGSGPQTGNQPPAVTPAPPVKRRHPSAPPGYILSGDDKMQPGWFNMHPNNDNLLILKDDVYREVYVPGTLRPTFVTVAAKGKVVTKDAAKSAI